jgi:hypothetical protein
MMRKALLVAAAAVVLPHALAAQTIGVGVRASTFGVGGEVSLRLMNNIGIRGGFGVFPSDYTGDIDDVQYTVEPTSPLMNVGVDFYPGRGGLRVGGGLLLISKETSLTGEYTGTVDIGGRTYTGSEVGSLTGLLDHGTSAPYVNIGFGRTTARGIGLFLDLGAAFMSEPGLTLTASGPAAGRPEFQADLERERQKAQEDARKYLKVLPLVSIGLKFGLM